MEYHIENPYIKKKLVKYWSILFTSLFINCYKKYFEYENIIIIKNFFLMEPLLGLVW